MKQDDNQRQWRTIRVPSNAFRDRMNETLGLADTVSTDKRTSVYSRLALIHQVAKACAREQATREGFPDSTIKIEELTDPPLSDDAVTDEPVLIRFSYSH